jgi:hypothetical protein
VPRDQRQPHAVSADLFGGDRHIDGCGAGLEVFKVVIGAGNGISQRPARPEDLKRVRCTVREILELARASSNCFSNSFP